MPSYHEGIKFVFESPLTACLIVYDNISSLVNDVMGVKSG